MVMKPEPLFEAVEALRDAHPLEPSTPIVLMAAQGRRLTQQVVEELALNDDLVLICGRYEGVDIVGLTAGASVPDELIDPIIEDLRARGVTSIEPVVVAEETVEFRPPEELEL